MAYCIYSFQIPVQLRHALGVVNIGIGLVAFIGNLLAFSIVSRNKHLRNRSNVSLLSLSATDLLVGLVVEPLTIMACFTTVSYNSEDGKCTALNTVRRYMSTVLMGASISSIAFVSYDRYVRLSKTVNYKQNMSKTKVAVLLVICWLFPIVLPFSRFTSESIYKAIIITYVLLIIVVMIACYVMIIRIVKRSKNTLTTNINLSVTQRTAMRAHIRAAKMIIVVVLCLLVTIGPISIYHGITAINGLSSNAVAISRHTDEICYAVLMTIGLLNSAINPLIYYFRIPEFRSTLKKLAKRCAPTCCARKARRHYATHSGESGSTSL